MEHFSVQQIREKEQKSHAEVYSTMELYAEGSWLKKPVKTVLNVLPFFEHYQSLYVLDLGCGVGRNSIAVARQFQNISCIIDCVDLLDIAISELQKNAEQYGVLANVSPILSTIEEYIIDPDKYDLILGISALEHVDTKESLTRKLREIREGLRSNGIVCLIMNSEITETDKESGKPTPAQFEVNLSTAELKTILHQIFSDCEILKDSVQEQHYDIPRDFGLSELRSNVITFVARK